MERVRGAADRGVVLTAPDPGVDVDWAAPTFAQEIEPGH